MGNNLQHSENIQNWLKLYFARGMGPKTFIRLLDRFGSVEKILGSSVSNLTRVERVGKKTAEKIMATVDDFDVQKELALAEKYDVTIINYNDQRYPIALKKIPDPPPILYYKGTLERSDSLAVSIVGSRRCSLYGTEQASRFAHILANSGFTIVSGMARGVDTAAHRGALAASGRTIAVQGCGLGNIFPPENEKVFHEITESGACISEFALQYEPLAENFPTRNRIIAGLSLATLVIEASSKSGSLITANLAMDYNKEVMAIPGKIDSPLNTGSHRLIKDGAKLVDCVEDIMEALGYIGDGLKKHVQTAQMDSQNKVEKRSIANNLNLSDYEKKVYETLNKEGVFIEEIISTTQLDVGQINSSLMSLRLKGLIKQLPGNNFAKL